MKAWTLVVLIVAAYAKNEEYNGWKSYSVTPSTYEQLKALTGWYWHKVDPLSYPLVNRKGIILVSPENQAPFTKFLNDNGISYKIHRDDVKAALDYDDKVMEEIRKKNIGIRRNGREMFNDNYQRDALVSAED